jgi:hypothetical protein
LGLTLSTVGHYSSELPEFAMQKRISNLVVASAIAMPLAAAASTTVCVNDVTTLQTALTNAQGSTSMTLIEVARGTYNLSGSALSFNGSSSTGQLDISGGFSSDCSTQILDPALTIVDGQYLSPVLYMTSGNGVSIRYLTIQHGSSDGYGAGLYVDVTGATGGIIVNYNIFRENAGEQDVALYALEDFGTTGDARVDGNLFANNNAVQYQPAGEVQNYGTGAIYVTNNTVVNNTVSTGSSGIPNGGLGVFGDATLNTILSNNIFWGNDVSDVAVGAAVFANNDYGVVNGTIDPSSGGNVSVDPQFSSATDFHLLPTSPVLGQGTLTPAGNLPTIDIEGHPRSYNGLVDMGAYERGDEIFGCGFDD